MYCLERWRKFAPFSVSAFYSRKSRPDDFEGDEFSEDSVDDSDRDKAYVQEDISDSSEYESDELIGTTRQSVSPSQSPTPSSVLQRSPTPSPTSWLYPPRRRGRISPSVSLAAEESNSF